MVDIAKRRVTRRDSIAIVDSPVWHSEIERGSYGRFESVATFEIRGWRIRRVRR